MHKKRVCWLNSNLVNNLTEFAPSGRLRAVFTPPTMEQEEGYITRAIELDKAAEENNRF